MSLSVLEITEKPPHACLITALIDLCTCPPCLSHRIRNGHHMLG